MLIILGKKLKGVKRDNANRRIPVSHKYPLGIEPRSLMMRSKQVDHWTSGTAYECSEIAGSAQGSPQQPTMSVVKPQGESLASTKPGQESCVRLSGIITLSVQGGSDGSRQSLSQTRPQ